MSTFQSTAFGQVGTMCSPLEMEPAPDPTVRQVLTDRCDDLKTHLKRTEQFLNTLPEATLDMKFSELSRLFGG